MLQVLWCRFVCCAYHKTNVAVMIKSATFCFCVMYNVVTIFVACLYPNSSFQIFFLSSLHKNVNINIYVAKMSRNLILHALRHFTEKKFIWGNKSKGEI